MIRAVRNLRGWKSAYGAGFQPRKAQAFRRVPARETPHLGPTLVPSVTRMPGRSHAPRAFRRSSGPGPQRPREAWSSLRPATVKWSTLRPVGGRQVDRASGTGRKDDRACVRVGRRGTKAWSSRQFRDAHSLPSRMRGPSVALPSHPVTLPSRRPPPAHRPPGHGHSPPGSWTGGPVPRLSAGDRQPQTPTLA